jgi:hypothetical protein
MNAVTRYEENSLVFDIGWLLHRLTWSKNERFFNIFSNYCEYIITHHGKGKKSCD